MQIEAISLFNKVARKALKDQKFYNILELQENIYDFRSYCVEKMSPSKAIDVYNRLVKKYQDQEKMKKSSEMWQQSQKRLFVWFMIVYTYFYKNQPQDLYSIDYSLISSIFFNKDQLFLQFHYLNLIKTCEKVTWNEQQDKMLLDAISQEGMKWSEISKRIFVFTNRQIFKAPKHCRQRWINHLDHTKVHGGWSDLEDYLIFEFVLEREGKKWAKMVGQLNFKRTEHMIKNRYNSIIARDRLKKQEKESQIARRVLDQLRIKLGKERTYFGHSKTIPQRKDTLQKQRSDSNIQKKQSIIDENSIQQNNPQISNRQQQQASRLVQQPTDQQKNIHQEMQSGICLKEENHSSQNQIPLKRQDTEQNCFNEENQLHNSELNLENNIKHEQENYPFSIKEEHNAMVKEKQPNECESLLKNEQDEDQYDKKIYPFENYSYEMDMYHYNKFNELYEYQQNQMIYYQNLMGYAPMNTNDTHLSTIEKPSIDQNINSKANLMSG